MMPETFDPVFSGLASLDAPAPDSFRADRVKARCRRVLAEQQRQRTAPKRRSLSERVFDATCFLVVGIYLAGAMSEAARLSGLL
ncbi:MAG TPA: hypothetical protein VFS23_21805 [Vicinamibacterales bacterium]|nr:hypothetical protein [Vicinamibacterales bacterium]